MLSVRAAEKNPLFCSGRIEVGLTTNRDRKLNSHSVRVDVYQSV